MKLRDWQQKCLDAAITHYTSGNKQFGCMATPGAGKSFFAACTVRRLFELNMIDYVICIAPSKAVRAGLKSTFEHILAKPMDGRFNAAGVCLTYHSLALLDPDIISRLRSYRLAIVVDEIHHCGGAESDNATAWAGPLLALMDNNHQSYTLSLSGTPWRSDGLPVTTLHYNELLFPEMHFCYGLNEAISDGVCRAPHITVVDNEHWSVTDAQNGNTEHESMTSLLGHEGLRYEMVLENPDFIEYMLRLSVCALNKRRKTNPDAGGLIIASSIRHAKSIQAALKRETREPVSLVTSNEPNSQSTLFNFKQGKAKWLVSVGMVTEGTDIPRLQVCCHLSRICTELHFRQVLGRILRCRGGFDANTADFLMPAHPALFEYAQRLQHEVPDAVALTSLSHPSGLSNTTNVEERPAQSITAGAPEAIVVDSGVSDYQMVTNTTTQPISERSLPTEIAFSAYGKYKEEVLHYYCD